jgi:hypothetical protein
MTHPPARPSNPRQPTNRRARPARCGCTPTSTRRSSAWTGGPAGARCGRKPLDRRRSGGHQAQLQLRYPSSHQLSSPPFPPLLSQICFFAHSVDEVRHPSVNAAYCAPTLAAAAPGWPSPPPSLQGDAAACRRSSGASPQLPSSLALLHRAPPSIPSSLSSESLVVLQPASNGSLPSTPSSSVLVSGGYALAAPYSQNHQNQQQLVLLDDGSWAFAAPAPASAGPRGQPADAMLQALLLQAEAGNRAAAQAADAARRADTAANDAADRVFALASRMGLQVAAAPQQQPQQYQQLLPAASAGLVAVGGQYSPASQVTTMMAATSLAPAAPQLPFSAVGYGSAAPSSAGVQLQPVYQLQHGAGLGGPAAAGQPHGGFW